MFNDKRRKTLKIIGLSATVPLAGSIYAAVTKQSATSTIIDPASIEGKGWAIGGTELLSDTFPDNSLFESSTPCSIEMTEPNILGPCFFSADSSNDISTGLSGLPMQLCLQLINQDCQPLAAHQIEVWHADNRGVYSADTSQSDESNRFRSWQCAGRDKAAKRSTWFRGSQTTDEAGRVNFKSCFPGWYGGRTIHVHLRIKHQNQVSFTSQLCFDEALTTEICTSHIKYIDRGIQDTPLARDRFFRGNTENALFGTRKNADGTLLAFKTLRIGS